MQKVLWILLGLNLYVNSMQNPAREYDQQKTQELKQILSICFNQHIFYSNNVDDVKIKQLISAGADPNVFASGSCYKEFTLLEALISFEKNYDYHPGLFEFLLENGANPNRMRSMYNHTPLITACHAGCYGASARLLKVGADVNHKTTHNDTPLRNAVMQSFMHAEHYLVQLLLENGAAQSIEVESDDLTGDGMQSPLTYARRFDFAEHYPDARKKIRELLELYKKQKIN